MDIIQKLKKTLEKLNQIYKIDYSNFIQEGNLLIDDDKWFIICKDECGNDDNVKVHFYNVKTDIAINILIDAKLSLNINNIKKIYNTGKIRNFYNLELSSVDNCIYELSSGMLNNCFNSYISFPDEIKQIGKEAFKLSNISSLIIPSNVIFAKQTDQSESQLESITYLKECKIENAIEIPKNCFENCYQLQKVELPSNLKKICKSAFENCMELSSIEFPNEIETIENAFSNTKIKILDFPENVVNINIFTNTMKHLKTLIFRSKTTVYKDIFNGISDEQYYIKIYVDDNLIDKYLNLMDGTNFKYMIYKLSELEG